MVEENKLTKKHVEFPVKWAMLIIDELLKVSYDLSTKYKDRGFFVEPTVLFDALLRMTYSYFELFMPYTQTEGLKKEKASE